MNRIIFLILILAIIFLTILLLVTGRGKSPVKIPVLFFNPSPTANSSLEQLPSDPLLITQVIPEDGTTNVSPDKQVQVVFNRSLNLNEIYISFGPSLIYKTV